MIAPKLATTVLFVLLLMPVALAESLESPTEPTAKIKVSDQYYTLAQEETVRINSCSEHEFTLLVLEDNFEVKLLLDGIASEPLALGDTYTFSNGVEIEYAQLENVYESRILINGESSTISQSETIELAGFEVSALIVTEDLNGPAMNLLVSGETTGKLSLSETTELSNGAEVTFLAAEKTAENARIKFRVGEEYTSWMSESTTEDVTFCRDTQSSLTLVLMDEQTQQVRLILDGDTSEPMAQGDTTTLSGYSVQVVDLTWNYESDKPYYELVPAPRPQEDTQESAEKPEEKSSDENTYQPSIAEAETSLEYDDSAEPTPVKDASDETDVQTTTEPTCTQGCLQGSICFGFGDRTAGTYCDYSGEFLKQKELEVACENDFECANNQCLDGVCKSISQELEETRGLLARIAGWFSSIFG